MLFYTKTTQVLLFFPYIVLFLLFLDKYICVRVLKQVLLSLNEVTDYRVTVTSQLRVKTRELLILNRCYPSLVLTPKPPPPKKAPVSLNRGPCTLSVPRGLRAKNRRHRGM